MVPCTATLTMTTTSTTSTSSRSPGATWWAAIGGHADAAPGVYVDVGLAMRLGTSSGDDIDLQYTLSNLAKGTITPQATAHTALMLSGIGISARFRNVADDHPRLGTRTITRQGRLPTEAWRISSSEALEVPLYAPLSSC